MVLKSELRLLLAQFWVLRGSVLRMGISPQGQLTLYYEPHCVYNKKLLEKERADIVITPVIKQLLPKFTLVSGQEDAVQLAKLLQAKFIVPMQNGDLDRKGLLASLVQSEGNGDIVIASLVHPSMPDPTNIVASLRKHFEKQSYGCPAKGSKRLVLRIIGVWRETRESTESTCKKTPIKLRSLEEAASCSLSRFHHLLQASSTLSLYLQNTYGLDILISTKSILANISTKLVIGKLLLELPLANEKGKQIYYIAFLNHSSVNMFNLLMYVKKKKTPLT